jgi:hypothetical protein
MAKVAKQVKLKDVKAALESSFKDAVAKLKDKITNAKEITAALKVLRETKTSILAQI